jgi:hypothetical protein
MRITLVALSCLALAVLAPGAQAQGTGPDATVESLATVVLFTPASGFTNFDFDLYNCPSGALITVEWQAEQPEPSTTVTGVWVIASSTGERVQHFTLSAEGQFRPGYRWEGSGTVTCGTFAIPVTGSGTTTGTNGM